MTNNKPTLQECAMRYGTAMGILWIFKFTLFPLGLSIPFIHLVFLVLTLGVPLVGFIFARRYRDLECGGSIGFGRAFLFTTTMYLFAIILTAAAHYVYFRFIDGGFIYNTWMGLWQQVKASPEAALIPDIDLYEQALEMMGAMTPLEVTFQLMSNNVFWSLVAALPTAILIRKS